MLDVIIASYLYQEYGDDDDLQAFVGAYNAGIQTYIDWFNSVGLPFYPGLTGALLDWVAQGLYGIARTALAAPVQPALGPLDTLALNTQTLDYFAFPTETYYTLSDDIFQRIITWNFYKGDGKIFCMRWLKRRIMRFMLGTNGLNPVPGWGDPSIGCETTTAVSVAVSGFDVTITINETELSYQANVAPGVVTLFSLALSGGVLDIPAQYNFTVVIETGLVATIAPTSLRAVSTSTTQTTASCFITVNGGSGTYTYSWSWEEGGTGINNVLPVFPESTTYFDTPSPMTLGTYRSGIAACIVTDTVTGHSSTCSVNVLVACANPVAVAPSTSAISDSGSTSSITTAAVDANASSGIPAYSYVWIWLTGGVDISIDSPAGAATTFTASPLLPGQAASGTAQCTVTDVVEQTAIFTVTVSINRLTVESWTVNAGTLDSDHVGWDSGSYGTISPPTVILPPSSNLLSQIITFSAGHGAGYHQYMQLSIAAAADPTQGFLTQILETTTLGYTLLGSAATSYSYSSGLAIWTWELPNSDPLMVSGSNYVFAITWA
jgi:hypothetical protein